MRGSLDRNNGVYKTMPDAVLSKANPVSATLYEVLPTTRNVRIDGMNVSITWAVTQPTPLELVITADGETIIHTFANPVSASIYGAKNNEINVPTAQVLEANFSGEHRAFLRTARTVKVEARITWAVTQPTPLTARVKYSKM